MLGWMLSKLFKKKKPDQSVADGADIILRMLENEAATLEMQAAAKKSGEPYVLLTPAVPLPARESAGWFGGVPRLPDDVPWPDIDGIPLRFACQVDLSCLPQNIWSGLGPRQGWLAVFFHPEKMFPKVLHVAGALKRREGPGQSGADWFWPRSYSGQKPVQDHSPEWPVTLQGHVGELPLPNGWRKGKAPGFPDPRDTETPALSDPAFHPFDEATLAALLEAVVKHFDRRKQQIVALLGKKLREDTRIELSRANEEGLRSREELSRITGELQPFLKGFAFEPVKELVVQIGRLWTHEISYSRDDEDGYAVLSVSPLTLDAKPNPLAGPWWYHDYDAQLYRHAVCAYTRNPEALHPDLRERLERLWQFEAVHEQAGMGHAPLGHIYTPYGPATPNEVLLELGSSNMVGWAWGDMRSIVLLIKRDSLAKGDFDKVVFDITN